ncbi:RGS domain-containing protein [Syncephalis plumigaleata]|nr:RGS domain-containing protein [Syncephalis plumigaleata]
MAPPTPYQKFLTMLDDRRQLAQFREFAAKNFCVEHVLFYEHCHRLYRLLTSPDGVSAQLLIEETREIVYLFLQPEAIYEINLSSRVRQSLKQASRQGKLGIRELEEAKDEVARILYQHTYPRYLRWRKDEMETDDIDTDTLVNGRQQHRPASPPPLPSSIRGLSSPSMLLPIVTVEKVNV